MTTTMGHGPAAVCLPWLLPLAQCALPPLPDGKLWCLQLPSMLALDGMACASADTDRACSSYIGCACTTPIAPVRRCCAVLCCALCDHTQSPPIATAPVPAELQRAAHVQHVAHAGDGHARLCYVGGQDDLNGAGRAQQQRYRGTDVKRYRGTAQCWRPGCDLVCDRRPCARKARGRLAQFVLGFGSLKATCAWDRYAA